MSKQMQYRVVREHYGDKAYATGDVRTADPGEVAHLVPNVLELIGPAPDEPKAEVAASTEAKAPAPAKRAGKAEPAPKNKAVPAAPANKAAPKPPAKRKPR